MNNFLRRVALLVNKERALINIKIFLKVLLCFFSAWVFGLIVFFNQIPEVKSDDFHNSQAFVILTGGKQRLDIGIEMFVKSNAKYLLISGLDSKTVKSKVKYKINRFNRKQGSKKQIIFGEIAHSTIQNAIETEIFMTLNNIVEASIITSNYHMPRVKYVFSTLLKDKQLHYLPIIHENFIKNGDYTTTSSFKLVVNEYNKFIMTVLLFAYEEFYDSFREFVKSFG
jgi:uncharacterized SAM-binding protein YcdF (DUF218 family)